MKQTTQSRHPKRPKSIAEVEQQSIGPFTNSQGGHQTSKNPYSAHGLSNKVKAHKVVNLQRKPAASDLARGSTTNGRKSQGVSCCFELVGCPEEDFFAANRD